MGVSIHPVTLQIRAGSQHDKYGDPYDIAVDMQLLGKDRAYLSCARGTLTRAVYAEIGARLREMGIVQVEWERCSCGQARLMRRMVR